MMVEIDGWAMNLAASDADRPILVTARDQTGTVLIGVDLSGQVLSHHHFASGVPISPASVKVAAAYSTRS